MPSPPRKKKKASTHGVKTVKTNKKPIVSSGRPRNKAEKAALQANPQPSMWKYISLPRGAPTKPKEKPSSTAHAAPPAQDPVTVITPAKPRQKKRKKKHTNWKVGIHRDAMAVALESMHVQGNAQRAIAAAQEKYPTVIIPRQTLDSKYLKYKQDMLAMTNDDDDGLDLDQFDRSKVVKDSGNNNKPSLTTDSDIKFLQDIAVARDNRNCGMSRQEMISFWQSP